MLSGVPWTQDSPPMPFHPVVEEWDADLAAGDPLGFPGYAERAPEPDGHEAVRTGRTGHYAFIESRFDVHGGSMGAAAGEKVVRAYDRARDLGLPVVVATLAVAEPVEVTVMFEEEIHEARLAVIDREQRLVVTVIEVLSPTNKVAGSRGRGGSMGPWPRFRRSTWSCWRGGSSTEPGWGGSWRISSLPSPTCSSPRSQRWPRGPAPP